MPRRYPLGTVLRYSAGQLLMLGLVLPAAVLGMGVWSVPFLLTRYVAPRFRAELDQVASYKLGTAFVAFPLWLATLSIVGWLAGGLRWMLGTALAAPALGLATVAWADRQADVREDVRVFLRARRLSRGRDRLLEQRSALVEEFDRLTREWRGDERTEAGA